jgi:hypothetical protein
LFAISSSMRSSISFIKSSLSSASSQTENVSSACV